MHHETASKQIARFAKNKVLKNSTQAVATKFLSTFDNDLLGGFTFEELVAYIRKKEVIQTAKVAILRCLHLACLLGKPDPSVDYMGSVSIRVAVSGELIARFQDKVFEVVNAQSNNLVAANSNFRAVTFHLFDQLRSGVLPRDIDRSVLKNFRAQHKTFHEAFNAWKLPDEQLLISRIRAALLGLYGAQSYLTPEDRDSVPGQQMRDQIDRLRAKWVQIAGTPSLDAFDAERGAMNSLVREVQALRQGNDGPAPRNAVVVADECFKHQLSNEDLAHELLLDPNFRFNDENINQLCRSVTQRAVQDRREQFFAHMEEDLLRDPAVYTCPMKIMTEVRDALIDLSAPDNRRAVAAELDLAVLRLMMAHPPGWFQVFDRAANIVRGVQGPGRVAAFASASADVAADFQGASTMEQRAKAMCKAMRVILQSVNRCRIDAANVRLALTARVVQDHGVDYEQGKFMDKVRAGIYDLSRTRNWLKRATEGMDLTTLDDSTRLEALCADAFADLLVNNYEVPETYSLDLFRIREMRVRFHHLAIGIAVLMHCYAFNGRGHSVVLLNQTVQYFRDLGETQPTADALRDVLCASSASAMEAEVKRTFVREAQPLFQCSHAVVATCFDAIGKSLRHYFKFFNTDLVPIQAMTHFNDALLEQFRMAHKIRALNFRVHHTGYRDILRGCVTEVDALTARMSLASIAPILRVVLPVDPILVVPGYTVANGTLAIEFFASDSPSERYRKASTGLLYAQANSSEQRTLITILTGAVREGGDMPPDPELPDDLGI